MRKLGILLLLTLPAHGDVLLLKDGKKISGSVTEKKESYEVRIEGEALTFEKAEVDKWIKSPRELTAEADKLVDEAKKIYLEAVELKDEKAADEKFRDGLAKVRRAREIFAEARDLFPEGHSELDESLVNTMKLMRLFRERIHTAMEVKESPVKPVPPEPENKPDSKTEAPQSMSVGEALAILVDPQKRAKTESRTAARDAFRALWREDGNLRDFAAACALILARDETPVPELQEYFSKIPEVVKFDTRRHLESAKALAEKAKALRAKTPEAAALLTLFASAHLSELLHADASADVDAVMKDLDFKKSETSPLWGTKEGLAMEDFRRWLSTGEYDLAIVSLEKEYKLLSDFGVRYAEGFLLLLNAISKKRQYDKAYLYFEALSKNYPSNARVAPHLLALAKSIRAVALCKVCGGTAKIRCNICFGKGKANFECKECGGSGQIQTLKGVRQCPSCKGAGGWKNADCPKCKKTGQIDCKAKGCGKPVSAPKFSDIAGARTCGLCEGRGTFMRHVAVVCPDCQGLGLFLAPKSDSSKTLR